MNGDLLTRVNFESLLSFHAQSQRHMTVCVRQHGTEIPYGVVELQDDRVTGVREKPQQVCFINAGIYVLDREVLGLIPSGRRYDVTELINASVQRGRGVASFPIHEYWLDIGGHSDYERAHLEYERYF
jgi:NDP-sugar pyrophosphorylase family protein